MITIDAVMVNGSYFAYALMVDGCFKGLYSTYAEAYIQLKAFGGF